MRNDDTDCVHGTALAAMDVSMPLKKQLDLHISEANTACEDNALRFQER